MNHDAVSLPSNTARKHEPSGAIWIADGTAGSCSVAGLVHVVVSVDAASLPLEGIPELLGNQRENPDSSEVVDKDELFTAANKRHMLDSDGVFIPLTEVDGTAHALQGRVRLVENEGVQLKPKVTLKTILQSNVLLNRN